MVYLYQGLREKYQVLIIASKKSQKFFLGVSTMVHIYLTTRIHTLGSVSSDLPNTLNYRAKLLSFTDYCAPQGQLR